MSEWVGVGVCGSGSIEWGGGSAWVDVKVCGSVGVGVMGECGKG